LQVLAVTVLTSLDGVDLRAMGCDDAVEDLVMRRARLAHTQRAAGVEASPLEAGATRAALPPPFLVVTPGIRPLGADAGDQKRLATPAAALAAGADYLVVGRPITRAADPAAAARAIVAEMHAALP
jgi:orotidine-5'-phosphate decarboxylase